MSRAYEKVSCPHCGQHIEYPADAAVESLECPNCSQPVSLCEQAVVEPPHSPTLPPSLPLPHSNAPLRSKTAPTKSPNVTGIGITALAVALLVILVLLLVLQSVRQTARRASDPITREYKSDLDILRLKTFTIGTNTDSQIADVVKLEISRTRYPSIDGSFDYRAYFIIRGTAPVDVDEGNNIRLEVDGKTFFWEKNLSANAETNSLGAAFETMIVTVPLESIHALTNCSSVVIHFVRLLRRLDVPLTAKNVEYLRVFAREAAKEDARAFKPVK